MRQHIEIKDSPWPIKLDTRIYDQPFMYLVSKKSQYKKIIAFEYYLF